MKFDPSKWAEFLPNKVLVVPAGRFTVQASAPIGLFGSRGVYEGCIGYAAFFSTDISAETEIWFTDEGVRAFISIPKMDVRWPTGPVFTNIDREPMESGSLLAVTQALREFKLEKMYALREIRRAAEYYQPRKAAEVAAADPSAVAAKADPEPSPEKKAVKASDPA